MDSSLIVALVGVGGTLLASAIGFAGNAILENIRLNSERKTHMIKALFDKEYELYQTINDKMISMTSLSQTIYNSIERDITKTTLSDEDKRFYRKECEKFVVAYNDTELLLAKSEPFIQKNIYETYKECLDSTNKVLSSFRDFIIYFKVIDTVDKSTIKNIIENKDDILYSVSENLKKSISFLHWAMDEIKHYTNSLKETKNANT